MSKQFAVIGNPIEQSRSLGTSSRLCSKKQGSTFSTANDLLPLMDFKTALKNSFREGGIGMNVTVPFKEQAYAQCAVLTERAKIAGSSKYTLDAGWPIAW